MNNTDLALQLLLIGLNHTADLGQLISNARSQGRDITEDELDFAATEYQTAKTALLDEIAKQRG